MSIDAKINLKAENKMFQLLDKAIAGTLTITDLEKMGKYSLREFYDLIDFVERTY